MRKKLQVGTLSMEHGKGETFNYVDNHGLMLTSVDNGGKGDCIGRSYKAYQTYKNPMFVDAVADLWDYTYTWNKDRSLVCRITGIRHPDLADQERKMSRDHYINTLALLKSAIRDGNSSYDIDLKFNTIIQAVAKVDNMMRFTFPLTCWTKALNGNRFAEFLFYVLEILTVLLLYIPMTKAGNLIAGFTEEVDQEHWEDYEPKDLAKQKKWKSLIDKAIYPAYARGCLITQIEALDSNFPILRNILKWLHRSLVGKTNYVQRLQLGMKVPEGAVDRYRPMIGGRWSGWLNNRNDREMRLLPMMGNKMLKKEGVEGYKYYNMLDMDWLRTIWNKKIGGD